MASTDAGFQKHNDTVTNKFPKFHDKFAQGDDSIYYDMNKFQFNNSLDAGVS